MVQTARIGSSQNKAPGSDGFSADLLASFCAAAQAEVDAARAQGARVVGRDAQGQRVEFVRRDDEASKPEAARLEALKSAE